MKNILFAVHRDGRKLYYPRWDTDGEIIPTKLPTAAVTVTQEGMTFPPGSTWIRKPRSWRLVDGWKLVEGETASEIKPRKKRAPNASLLFRYSKTAHCAQSI
jgi:hypothetical protein